MKSDPLVAELEKAAHEYDGLSMLVGLVGQGSKKGLIRLYLRPQLDWYVEFDEDAVKHRMPFPENSALAGGSALWVVPNTKLTDVTTSDWAEEAQFLRGPLTDGQPGGGDETAHAAALPATVLASSGLCAATVVGTVVVVTITIASYNLCGTSGGTAPLGSALAGPKCVGVTTNATVICHPQTETMGTYGPGPGGGGGDKEPDDGGDGPVLA